MHVFIQARTNSTRFPNKIMADLGGKTILWHVIETAKSLTLPVVVVVPRKDPVIDWLIDNKILYYEGSENDVLSRFYDAALAFKANSIMRLTSDCPLLDPTQLLHAYFTFKRYNLDFYSNTTGCVDGHDVETMSFRILKYMVKMIDSKEYQDSDKIKQFQKEHVTTHIKENDKMYRDIGFKTLYYGFIPYSDYMPKLSVDTKEDLENVRKVYNKIIVNKKFWHRILNREIGEIKK